MKTLFKAVLAGGLMCSAAAASNINISVQGPNGEPSLNVAANSVVSYRVVGTLTDDVNEGLALIGLSLNYTGGDIGQQADTPADNPPISCANPMRNFVIPEGITNPAGYGGTIISGDLVQVGGAQNTINNTADNADFPVGTVLTGVAQPGGCGQAIIATGSFNVGAATGNFQLQALDIFANVIQDGEDGTVFWATEAAGVGTVVHLNINVGGDVPANFVSSVPPHTAVGVQTAPAQGSLPRSLRNTLRLTFDDTIIAPTAGQLLIQPLTDGGGFGADISASFTFTVEGGTVLRTRDNAGNVQHRTWYAIRNTGGWAGVANFEIHFPSQIGDANGDGRTLFSDLGFINAQVPTSPVADNVRRDINGDGSILFSDLGAANARIPSDLVPKPTGH